MKRKKVLISSEVKEEVIDIFSLLKSKDVNAAVFLSSNIDIDGLSVNKSCRVFQEKKISKIKLIQKIYSLFYFFWVSLIFRPNVIFSGFSMLKYRLISKIFSVYHVAYFRGLLFDSSNRSGICDRLYYGKLGKIKFLRKILCTYYADLVIVTSDVSRKFILERDPEIKIVSSGPVWLNVFRRFSFNKSNFKNIIFLTQAFDSHGFSNQHKSQIESLVKVDKFCFLKGISLMVRVHPRDYFDYSALDFLSNVIFDSSDSSHFLSMTDYISDSVIVSPLSTFAFEILYLGGLVFFYTSSSLNEIYKKSYINLGINAFDFDGELDDFLSFSFDVNSVFSDCSEEFLKEIDNVFSR